MNIKEKGVFMNIACSLSKIGEILLKQNKITDEQLNEALILQASNGKKLGEILIERGYITEIRHGDVSCVFFRHGDADMGRYHVSFLLQTCVPASSLPTNDTSPRLCNSAKFVVYCL